MVLRANQSGIIFHDKLYFGMIRKINDYLCFFGKLPSSQKKQLFAVIDKKFFFIVKY